MKIAIHQPNFMPWVGYFNKINSSDKFVFLDNVKCSKNSFFNRNRFSTSRKFNDYFWLTCPLSKSSYKKNLIDVECNNSFLNKHIKHFKIRYGKTKEVSYLQEIISLYELFKDNAREEKIKLIDLNKEIIKTTCNYLDIKTEIIDASKMNNIKDFKKQELVLGIVKELSGSAYISGTGAKDYQDENIFFKENIQLMYLKSDYSKVPTINSEHMSTIDLILQEGAWKVKEMILH